METPGSKPTENLPEAKPGFIRIATGSLTRAIPLFFALVISIAIAWMKPSLDVFVLVGAAFLITLGLILSVRKGSRLMEQVAVWCLVAIWCISWWKVLLGQDVLRLLLVSFAGMGSAFALSYLRRPWRLPYARPYRQWFEGTWSSTRRLDLFFPGEVPVRVHRMSREGAWFVMQGDAKPPKILDLVEVHGEGLTLQGRVRSLWILESSIGVGIEFTWSDLNHQRKMTEIIERFRGASFC